MITGNTNLLGGPISEHFIDQNLSCTTFRMYLIGVQVLQLLSSHLHHLYTVRVSEHIPSLVPSPFLELKWSFYVRVRSPNHSAPLQFPCTVWCNNFTGRATELSLATNSLIFWNYFCAFVIQE
jgi:hypothetical protein